jgi:hypothetical protein
LTWVGFVYWGPDGPAHLKVFFWNNLAGRFAQVEAPDALQYAAAHRNTPGKYFIELPVYLWPWTLLCVAAVRRAWQRRTLPPEQRRADQVRGRHLRTHPGGAVRRSNGSQYLFGARPSRRRTATGLVGE